MREYAITTVCNDYKTCLMHIAVISNKFQQVKLSDESDVEAHVQRVNQMALVETGEKRIKSKQAIRQLRL